MNKVTTALKELAVDGISIRVTGDCMRPSLTSGTSVRLARGSWLLPGDILAYCDGQGRIIVHRLLGYYWRGGSWRLLLQADSAQRPDLAIRPQDILGRAMEVRVPVRHRIRALARYASFAVDKLVERALHRLRDQSGN